MRVFACLNPASGHDDDPVHEAVRRGEGGAQPVGGIHGIQTRITFIRARMLSWVDEFQVAFSIAFNELLCAVLPAAATGS